MKKLLFLFLGLAACQQSPVPFNQDAITKAVEQTLLDYNAAVKAGGLTAEFNFLDHSPNFFWVPPGFNSAISYDSVASILKQNAPTIRSLDNQFDDLKIIALSNDYAAYNARIRSISVDTSGNTSQYLLIETGMLVRRESGWKLLHGQTALLDQ